MSGWDIEIGEAGPIVAMDCFGVMTGVQAVLVTSGIDSAQALDLAEEAWLRVESQRYTWSTPLPDGRQLKVGPIPVYRGVVGT